MTTLPIASAESQAHSQQLRDLIAQKIAAAGGWILFAQFMQMALYTPSLGYYSGAAKKFADDKFGGGDFVTAPQISPLFAQTIAHQAAEILARTQGNILELGAGTGKLAADLLLELAELNQLPNQYFILEVSDHLRQVQLEVLQNKLPTNLFKRVVWLKKLPENFVGLIIGNEVLDALAVHLLIKNNGTWLERGVAFDGDFIWQDKPLNQPDLANNLPKELLIDLQDSYLTEVCPSALGLMNSLVDCLKQGVILMLDYGFGATEYYHPQRNQGTLMCHYQHYAHSNPLINIGLQDITSHVNFTQIVSACKADEVKLAGYVSQAQFLINCGILDLLAKVSPNDMATYAPLAAAAQKLLSPAEMGELFKVIAFTKNMDVLLLGFTQGDKSHTL